MAFLASGLAFGRVAGILRSLENLLIHLGPRPAAGVRAFDPLQPENVAAMAGHRWVRGSDLVVTLGIIRQMLEQSGTIEGFFLEGHDRSAPDVEDSLERFSARALSIAGSGGQVSRGVRSFFPRPSDGSACKRLNLFLRWMVRRDGVDLGLWTGVRPSQLIVPLDIHIVRAARALGLTCYRTPGWRMAADITASLRRLDPEDPLRYDFALCHAGIDHACRFDGACRHPDCPLWRLCRRMQRPDHERRSASRR